MYIVLKKPYRCSRSIKKESKTMEWRECTLRQVFVGVLILFGVVGS